MDVGIGATKDCISFHTMSPALVKKMKPELEGLNVSDATMHFNPGKPIPEELITKIIVPRKKENEAWHDATTGSSGLWH